MFRKAIITAAAVLTIVGGTAGAAHALDCANVSRPAPAEPASPVLVVPGGGPTIWVVQGDWWYISFDGVFADGVWDFVPPGTAASVIGLTQDQAAALGLPAGATNGNYQAGQGFGLLDNAQAPCNPNRQTTNGIQGESFRCEVPGA